MLFISVLVVLCEREVYMYWLLCMAGKSFCLNAGCWWAGLTQPAWLQAACVHRAFTSQFLYAIHTDMHCISYTYIWQEWLRNPSNNFFNIHHTDKQNTFLKTRRTVDSGNVKKIHFLQGVKDRNSIYKSSDFYGKKWEIIFLSLWQKTPAN